ncbi:unnamed protein product [Protopolystoma xenopodis]|uniref:Uncharacterized protein n=1 Tax=Protopolystoma xenopodis TaxID=117903 RepID=A0A448XED1_9PLAT|nr:unnamed protein product [Protopolystoma xenopodis]
MFGSYPTSRESSITAGPRGEVRERCVQLATGRLLLNELWRERWDRLHLLLEVRQFSRDASACFDWLRSREAQLAAQRRQLGDSLAETLRLLGAHEAFERTLAGAEDRFNVLRRLTTLELRAMEWKPEISTQIQQEKRAKVRNAVQEFLPPMPRPQIRSDSHLVRGGGRLTHIPPGGVRILMTSGQQTQQRQPETTAPSAIQIVASRKMDRAAQKIPRATIDAASAVRGSPWRQGRV